MRTWSSRQLTAVVSSFSITLIIISSLYLYSGPQILPDLGDTPVFVPPGSVDTSHHGDLGPEAEYSSDPPGGSWGRLGDEWWSGMKSGIGKIATHWGLSPERAEQVAKIRSLSENLQEYYTLDSRPARVLNYPALEQLASCLENWKCTKAQEKVVILASGHFQYAVAQINFGGEDIWAMSTIEAFRSLNYTIFFANGPMEAYLIYSHMPDMVKTVIFEPLWGDQCNERNNDTYLDSEDEDAEATWQTGEKGCGRRVGFEQGIPLWKSFHYHFWTGSSGPLGHTWTLAPEDWQFRRGGHENQYLGYSIETYCHTRHFYPPEERDHRGFTLAKMKHYFYQNFAWENALNDAVDIVPAQHVEEDGEEVPFHLVAAAHSDDGILTLAPYKVDNIGRVPREAWYDTLARSKFMLGIAYDALCLGVPFINPIWDWDRDHPDDKFKWEGQHEGLFFIPEPYVYNVKVGDAEGLQAAFLKAVANPIGSYIPPRCTREAVRERHRLLVETDWLPVAQRYVQEEYLDQGKEWNYLL